MKAHGLEAISHECVVEDDGTCLLDGCLRGYAIMAQVPAVECHQSECDIDEHESQKELRDLRAETPDSRKQPVAEEGCHKAGAEDAEYAPQQHEMAVRSTVYGQERPRIVPGHYAEERLHEVTGRIFH